MGNVLIDISSSNIFMTLLLPAKAKYIARLHLGAVSINGLTHPMQRLLLSKAQGCKTFENHLRLVMLVFMG